ncbi:MAG: hypothetical protein ACHQF3_08765 [Alphaproteobacteria bacterium]
MFRRMLLLILAAASGAAAAAGIAAAAGPSWQYSVTPSYRLEVRDKFGDLEQYDATFTVSDGKSGWHKTIHVKGDAWGSALFPDDFEGDSFANFNNVRYKWQATVAGKVVASGSFKLAAPP